MVRRMSSAPPGAQPLSTLARCCRSFKSLIYTRLHAMGLRVCLVTPFDWAQPHDVNEHVDGVAAALRALSHDVTVLAPSTRARDLAAGRRALADSAGAEVIALGA